MIATIVCHGVQNSFYFVVIILKLSKLYQLYLNYKEMYILAKSQLIENTAQVTHLCENIKQLILLLLLFNNIYKS